MYLTVHGIKTQYQKMGHGPVLILLHGWGCDWQIWYPLIQSLSQHHTLLLPDMPAFGESANPPTTWGSADYVLWLTAFIEATCAEQPVHLIGHSFGGKIAALYAAAATNTLLKSLVLIDSAGLPDKLSLPKQLQEKVLSVIPSTIKNVIPLHMKRAILQSTGSATDHLNSTAAQRAILARSIKENISEQLKKITTNTLLIWGEHDQETPIAQAKLFATYLRQNKLVIVPDAGHFVFVDQPHMVLDSIEEFLQT